MTQLTKKPSINKIQACYFINYLKPSSCW